MRSVIIPQSVTRIGANAFDGCTSLTIIELINNIITLAEKAFLGCISLKSIKFINNTITLNNDIFKGCTSLTRIEIINSIINLQAQTIFDNIPLNIYIRERLRVNDVNNALIAKNSHLYITSETKLEGQCKIFFGSKSVYVHIQDQHNTIDQQTQDILDYIAISITRPYVSHSITIPWIYHTRIFHRR